MINRKARPKKYESPRDYIAVNFAARTMRWTGIIVALFLLFHLADLTWGINAVELATSCGASRTRTWPTASIDGRLRIFYILGNLALGIHLYHGGWSIFQSLGSMSPRFNPRHNPLRRGFAAAFAIIVAGINISFPIAVLTGVVAVG